MSGSSNGRGNGAAAAAAAAEQLLGNGGGGGGSNSRTGVVGAGLPALGTGVSSNPSSPRLQNRGGIGGGGGPGGGQPPPVPRLPITALRSSASGSGAGGLGTPHGSSFGGGGGSVPHPVNNLNHLSDRLGSLSTFSDDFGSSEDPNAPAKMDFMVSFLVDARGGSMVGCRHSGVKVSSKAMPDNYSSTSRSSRHQAKGIFLTMYRYFPIQDIFSLANLSALVQ